MPFDGNLPAEVTARDRMIQLRDFLAGLPARKFNMSEAGVDLWANPKRGSSACIGGWARILFCPYPDNIEQFVGLNDVGEQYLGLTYEQTEDLFFRWKEKADLPHAVAVIDHYLATGEIDWSVAKEQTNAL